MSYRVELGSRAAREFRKLPASKQQAVRTALRELAERIDDDPGWRGAKRVKAIRGRSGERLLRARVGEHRIMFEILDQKRKVLVSGIVHRRDLERWLRS